MIGATAIKGKEGYPDLYGAFSCLISPVKISSAPYHHLHHLITQFVFLCCSDIIGHHFAPVILSKTMTREEVFETVLTKSKSGSVVRGKKRQVKEL